MKTENSRKAQDGKQSLTFQQIDVALITPDDKKCTKEIRTYETDLKTLKGIMDF